MLEALQSMESLHIKSRVKTIRNPFPHYTTAYAPILKSINNILKIDLNEQRLSYTV